MIQNFAIKFFTSNTEFLSRGRIITLRISEKTLKFFPKPVTVSLCDISSHKTMEQGVWQPLHPMTLPTAQVVIS